MLNLISIKLSDANAFVAAHHRHHRPVTGHKFSLGCEQDGQLVGVAIVERPVSRYLDDGKTLEVNRLCTTGEKNACSFLYGAAARAAKALGYHTTEKAGRAYHDNRLPLADWAVPSAPSAEDLLLEADGAGAAKVALIQRVRGGLTEKQFRRLRLYYLERFSEREIARAEGVGQQRVSRSILTGKKALEKIFLEIFGDRG